MQRFVGDHADGPASLTLAGEAGIGKTAIWRRALLDAEAAGVAVRACRCSQSDAVWSFAGLGDCSMAWTRQSWRACRPSSKARCPLRCLSSVAAVVSQAAGWWGSRCLECFAR